jgi:CPA2 family monovalent cation:H+ antiporter-2
MEDLGLVGDLAVLLVAALVGGALAHALRLPALLGYLAAGFVIGPHTPGFVSDVEQVQTLADLGVALLMFSLGVRFRLRELLAARNVALLGGGVQVCAMIVLGVLVGWGLGIDRDASLLLGGAIALSSTMVALKLLEERGELGTVHGRVVAGIALVQDLSLVPIIVVIPAITGGEGDAGQAFGLAVAKAVALLLGIYVLGAQVVPRLLGRVAATRSRELFLLSTVALALGTAAVSSLAGLSLAFGAFLAGLLVSESEYSQQTLVEVLPLREIFAVVFFVSIGMLIDPDVFVEDPQTVLAITAAGVFGKILLVTGLALAFGYMARTALAAGMALGNMGEFSFVLATVGVDEEIFSAELNSTLLASVSLSIGAAPFLMRAHPRLAAALASAPLVKNLFQDKGIPPPPGSLEPLANHVVIAGYGESGRELARVLRQRGFKYLVVDQDPVTIRRLRRAEVPCIYGDPSNPIVLEQTRLERARVLAITIADLAEAQAAVLSARKINPRLDVIVRGADVEGHFVLREAGAAEVVHAEFEAGLEFVRHTLHRYGVSTPEIEALLSRRRQDYYARRF